MMRLPTAVLLGLGLFLLGGPAPGPAHAQETEADTTKFVPGARYEAGWFHRLFYGTQHRNLWTTGIEVNELDLANEAGGLEPVGVGGGLQTLSLRFVSADGTPYSFRSLDKSPVEILPPDLRGTFIENVVQDQISSSHPTGAVVVPPLLGAVGILHATPKIVVLPDDPRLGEARETFAGLLGTFEQWPNEGKDGSPGFAGSRVVVSTDELIEIISADPDERIDTEGYLTARLIDFLVGDWDRHRGQWRWARLGEGADMSFRPVPEDRDQAFAVFDGTFLRYARLSAPQLTKFGAKYDGILGMSWNGRDVDRRFLVWMEEAVWDSVVSSVQERVTDTVIADAVGRLPEAHYELVGEEMIANLQTRRDRLPELAGQFYRQLADAVDLHASDKPDSIEVERQEDGSVSLAMYATGGDVADPEPYAARRFEPDVTHELRIYLLGGDDRVTITGEGSAKIKIRVVSGIGSDVVADSSSSGGVKVYDHRASPQVSAPGLSADYGPHKTAPLGPTVFDERDWGSRSFSLPSVYAAPDLDLVLAWSWNYQRFGFRKTPYSRQHKLDLAFATGEASGRIGLLSDWRRENSATHTTLQLLASGIEQVRFFGYGNETEKLEDSEFYRTDQAEFVVEPALHLPLGSQSTVSLGVAANYFTTEEENDFISTTQPYGFDNFGQVKVVGGFKADTRDNESAGTKGVVLELTGAYVPEVWGVDQGAYGSLSGVVGGLATPGERITLGLRAGGKKVWGTFPFQEAAYIGGFDTVRGFNEQRFAGDASIYGNLEVRLALARYYFLLPGDLGIFGLVDTGRVFLSGETSSVWHTGAGGGIWIAPRKRTNALTLAVVGSSELVAFYLAAGFAF